MNIEVIPTGITFPINPVPSLAIVSTVNGICITEDGGSRGDGTGWDMVVSNGRLLIDGFDFDQLRRHAAGTVPIMYEGKVSFVPVWARDILDSNCYLNYIGGHWTFKE